MSIVSRWLAKLKQASECFSFLGTGCFFIDSEDRYFIASWAGGKIS
jgi:hypothetical protein